MINDTPQGQTNHFNPEYVRQIQSELFAANGKILELEQRVKVLVVGLRALNYTASENSPNTCIVRELLRQTPQQSSAQIERGHIKWMMKLPVFAYSYKSSKGHDIVNHEFCRELIAICPADMVVTKLVAIPPLPKESVETDLDQATRLNG